MKLLDDFRDDFRDDPWLGVLMVLITVVPTCMGVWLLLFGLYSAWVAWGLKGIVGIAVCVSIATLALTSLKNWISK